MFLARDRSELPITHVAHTSSYSYAFLPLLRLSKLAICLPTSNAYSEISKKNNLDALIFGEGCVNGQWRWRFSWYIAKVYDKALFRLQWRHDQT